MLFPYICPDLTINLVNDHLAKEIVLKVGKNDGTMKLIRDVIDEFNKLKEKDIIVSKDVAEKMLDYDGFIFNKKNMTFKPEEEMRNLLFFGENIWLKEF